jgi:hypothetical protein
MPTYASRVLYRVADWIFFSIFYICTENLVVQLQNTTEHKVHGTKRSVCEHGIKQRTSSQNT